MTDRAITARDIDFAWRTYLTGRCSVWDLGNALARLPSLAGSACRDCGVMLTNERREQHARHCSSWTFRFPAK